jgi:hypothetical protein
MKRTMLGVRTGEQQLFPGRGRTRSGGEKKGGKDKVRVREAEGLWLNLETEIKTKPSSDFA